MVHYLFTTCCNLVSQQLEKQLDLEDTDRHQDILS